MSIESEITRLASAKSSIKQAIENKGVIVGSGTIDTYADKIAQITTGGGTGKYKTDFITAYDASEQTINIGFVPDVFIANIIESVGVSGMKTRTWIKSTTINATILQNYGTSTITTKFEDFVELTSNGVKIKRYGSYNICPGVLFYQAYKL